jgi:drug/metabolite transporter, DME family
LQDLTPSSSCGLIQPILRFLTYAGIHYVGAAAGTTLRGAHPLFSTSLAILFLGESLNLLIVLGTISIVAGVALISWQGDKKQASFRWWHLAYPLSAAFLAGVSAPATLHTKPCERATLPRSGHRHCRTPVAGQHHAIAWAKQRPVWDRRAMGPFLIAGTFETLGILLVIVALSVGRVVVVSPIVATSPLWIVLGAWLFLRDVERLTVRTILGAVCVVAGTIAIAIVR